MKKNVQMKIAGLHKNISGGKKESNGKISIHIWDRKGRGIGQREEYDKGQ